MGLLSRLLEESGVPTISMSSALDITESVKPPRSIFLNFPLGHTTGKPNDVAGQLDILRQALTKGAAITQPGTVVHLPHEWGDDSDHRWQLEWQADLRYLKEVGSQAVERVKRIRSRKTL